MKQLTFVISKMALIPLLTVQGMLPGFPREYLKFVHDVIFQANASNVNVVISREYSSFSTSFLDLVVNGENIYPVSIQTFQEWNNSSSLKTVIMHIISDNSDDSFNVSSSILYKKMKRKSLYKFVVLIENTNRNADDKWLEKLFEQFYNKRILDVMIIYYDKALVFTRYNPFIKDQIIKMNYSLAKNDFQSKYIIPDLNGHQFKVIYYPDDYFLHKPKISNNNTKHSGAHIDMCNTLIER